MPKFKVGDHVERIGSLVPPYMRYGTVTHVTPYKVEVACLTEYEVNFGDQVIGIFYETQLRLLKPAKDSS